jgi:putative transposase
VTEALCGHSFSASSISTINKSLDEALKAFAQRRLTESYPYLILDARYEKVREAGVIVSQAVLVAVAVDGEGRRQVLAVELANRESRSSWRDFLSGLKKRGLAGVEFVVSDNHEGLKTAIREVLPEAAWQRCYVHFLRNALDYVPRKSLPSRKRGWTTTACRSCAGFTTAASSPRSAATSRLGSANGRANTRGCATGSRATSKRP